MEVYICYSTQKTTSGQLLGVCCTVIGWATHKRMDAGLSSISVSNQPSWGLDVGLVMIAKWCNIIECCYKNSWGSLIYPLGQSCTDSLVCWLQSFLNCSCSCLLLGVTAPFTSAQSPFPPVIINIECKHNLVWNIAPCKVLWCTHEKYVCFLHAHHKLYCWQWYRQTIVGSHQRKRL